ncbi:MAG: hypothetical protein HOV94_39005 [Saccharothrix sp.]|nr:hypothetical protein [Saccharothrix sp.]
MTDLRALHDAFEELERRADAATADRPFDLPARTRASRPGTRLVPLAVAAAVVAGLATGAVLFLPDRDRAADTVQAAGSASTTSTPSVEPTRPPAHESPELLAERFRAVLGDLATFEVTETAPGAMVMTMPPSPPPVPPSNGVVEHSGTGTGIGSAIVGTLTASGVTGGFDLVMYPGEPGDRPGACDLPTNPSCTVQTLPDGSTLATAQVALESGGTTHEVRMVRPDGLVFIMHVSNRQSPKGSGALIGAQPPLTVDQLVAIATSDRW